MNLTGRLRKARGPVIGLFALTVFANAAFGQLPPRVPPAPGRPPGTQVPYAKVPFAPGEELTYRVTFGGVKAGVAKLRVQSIDTVRGRPAYHIVFTIEGGIPLLRVRDRYESWLDVETLSSLRYVQDISEGSYRRNTTYEIYPERLQYQKNQEPILPSVENALDEVAFIFAVRAAGAPPGESRMNRYFKPEGNPVILTSMGTDTVTVGAGTYVTTAIRPSFSTAGLFAESTDARIWLSRAPFSLPVRIQTKFARFTVTMTLESITRD